MVVDLGLQIVDLPIDYPKCRIFLLNLLLEQIDQGLGSLDLNLLVSNLVVPGELLSLQAGVFLLQIHVF